MHSEVQWDIIILNKVQELGRLLLGETESLDFTEPRPDLARDDTLAIRQRILELTQKQARELGIRKNTLHYLRKHAKSDKSFKVYEKVAARLS